MNNVEFTDTYNEVYGFQSDTDIIAPMTGFVKQCPTVASIMDSWPPPRVPAITALNATEQLVIWDVIDYPLGRRTKQKDAIGLGLAGDAAVITIEHSEFRCQSRDRGHAGGRPAVHDGGHCGALLHKASHGSDDVRV